MRQVLAADASEEPMASPAGQWNGVPARASLSESFRTLPIPPKSAGFLRRLFAFVGPGYLVAVGYMDPGNWATDLAGGSAYGYLLLSVVLASSLAAMVLQSLSARLGIGAGRDLAQACRDAFPAYVNLPLWAICELAIVACDLAELIGAAVALQLLFGLPLLAGVLLTGFDVILLLALQRLGVRWLEAVVVALLAVIGGAFAVELWLSRPDWAGAAAGLVPSPRLLTDPTALYLAVGILGATVMPHNLYLHSALVQSRRYALNEEGRREALRFATIDSTVALGFAFFVNAAILVLAASAFPRARAERGGRAAGRAPPARAAAGRAGRGHAVRAGAPRVGAELHRHRHAGGAGGDGGVPGPAAEAVAAPHPHARDRARARRGRDRLAGGSAGWASCWC